MFQILWDPSSGSIKRASLKLLVMFCVRSRCLARSAYGGEERGAHGFGGETWGKETIGETQTQMGG